MLPIKLTASTTPAHAAAATHAARQAQASAPWQVVAACVALVTKTHTLQRAIARATAAAALVPQGAGSDWLEAFATRLGRTQTESATKAAAWATQYAQVLAALQPTTSPPAVAPPAVDTTPAPAPTVTPPAPEPVAPGKHRYQQRQLFQGAPSVYLTDGSFAFEQDIAGPNHVCVSTATGWRWGRPGGDWTDINGAPYGLIPWASAPSVGASHEAKSLSMDVTALVNECHRLDTWLAVLLQAVGAERRIAGRTHREHAAPVIRVVYADGTPHTLVCTAASDAGPSTEKSLGRTALEIVSAPAFLEFESPTGSVQTATLTVTVVEHWSGSNPRLQVQRLTPPTAAGEKPVLGLASACPLDAGITAHPAVIGAHAYRDGEDPPVVQGPCNITNDAQYSPHLWGAGPRDKNLLPDRGLGLWINLPEHARIVPSTDTEPGFTPLAPGLGALRLHMPARDVKRGDIVTSSGDLACNATIYLPEDIIGRQRKLYVRYFVRIAPFRVGPEHRVLVQHEPGSWSFTTLGGKSGITPDHTTALGGVSATSGGPYGYQLRHSWCMNHSPGPDNEGLVMGHHMYDYYLRDRCPVGHDYAKDPTWWERWGRLGLGVIYPGHWYCIENELDLNTIMGAAPGWQPDGALRTWIDGVPAYARTGMVFRTGPVSTSPATQRPMRELGIRNLWLNWFHGGKTWNTVKQTHWYTGLVWSAEYIGPMQMQKA